MRGTMVTLAAPCEICGGRLAPSRVGRPTRFCSRKCAGVFVGLRNAARLRRPPAEKACEWCGVAWVTYHRKQRFCSRRCSSRGKSKTEAMRLAGRVDKNQPAIVDALREHGASVLITSSLGRGFPDLIVGHGGRDYLLEVKNPENWYGRRGLNKNQIVWHQAWRGHVTIVTSVQEALDAVFGQPDAWWMPR